MAYFRCQQGSSSGSAGATITVTYYSSFYNKTMTCTNGTKTYTKTTTSSGSTTFNVNEEGTWTITCNGVSRTVDVVLEYTTQMAITKTVDVYSAASDTVSFTDVNGAKTVTTDASGHGSVSITFIPDSTITFTSSVAKNPSNLSQAYSKTITMTDNITSIYVMPDTTIYWYGFGGNNFTNYPALHTSSQSSQAGTIELSQDTNSITINIRNGAYSTGKKVDVTNKTKAKCYVKTALSSTANYISSTYFIVSNSESTTNIGQMNAYQVILPTNSTTGSTGAFELNISSVTGDAVIGIGSEAYPGALLQTVIEYLFVE